MYYDINKLYGLNDTAKQIRRSIIEMIYTAQSGHPGSALSCTDILTALYFEIMNISAENPDDPNRDRFVMSKGHACPAMYCSLIHKGFIDKKEVANLRKINSILQGHPDMNKVPGIDMTTGSLGQGLSAAVGMAMAAKMDQKEYYTYALVGDGEINEGQIWEAIMFASKFKLNNLIVFMDYNTLQLDGTTDQIMPLEPLADKLKAFNWHVLEIDGNDIGEIIKAVNMAKQIHNKPIWIIAHTTKGCGVSYMENKLEWHGKAPNEEEYEIAIKELI